jgi:hypothetical protein
MNFIKRLLRGKIEETKDEIRDWEDPEREANPMACDEITIEEVPQALYEKLLADATAAGAVFVGTKATIEGMAFDWNYDAPTETLHVTCLKKPFYISCAAVEQHLRERLLKAKNVVG